jgi:hypothetical protein
MSDDKMAESLGIVANTYAKYYRNEALTYERRVLERAADLLRLKDIGELLELANVDFFPAGQVQFLGHKPRVDPDDQAAEAALAGLFRSQPGFQGGHIPSVYSEDRTGLAEQIYLNDCIILGSLRNNKAGEVALSLLFGVDPSDCSEASQRRVPLLIEAPLMWYDPSAFVRVVECTGKPPWHQFHVRVSETGKKDADRSFKGKTEAAVADYCPPDRFEDASTAAGKDYGIILIADHRIGGRETPVRTFWISGFSAVGTFAAAMALEKEIRNFSVEMAPKEDGKFVLAIVRTTFIKDSGSMERRPSEKTKLVHLIQGSLPKKVVPPIGVSHVSRLEAVVDRPASVDRMRELLAYCKIVLRKRFASYEQTIITLYEGLLPRFSDQQFSEKMAEFKRSIDGTPQDAYERRAVSKRDEDFHKMISFLSKLFTAE